MNISSKLTKQVSRFSSFFSVITIFSYFGITFWNILEYQDILDYQVDQPSKSDFKFFLWFWKIISKVLDYRVDQPSRVDFKFFLWFWKKYFSLVFNNFFKSLRYSSWPTKYVGFQVFFSGFGITISKILDYRVDRPSRSEFKFFLWFWKIISKILDYQVDRPSMLDFKFFLWFWNNYFKNLRLSSWPTK